MTIAGSTYVEKCMFPYWNELYGSGWRAVSALAEHTTNIDFFTYSTNTNKENLKLHPFYNKLNSINITTIKDEISFDYFHGLSEPKIYPSFEHLEKNRVIEPPSNDVILRYGFIEGEAKVSGKRVVYDPQSSYSPADFYSNGSTADELVMVLNYREASILSGSNNIEDFAKKLMINNTIAIILKLGPSGGKIITREYIKNYSVYKTQKVFPIGSGDVFAAFIAYFWGEKKCTLEQSANLASKAVAIYCESQTLPIKQGYESKEFIPIEANLYKKRKVYLAGPFFTMNQRWIVEEARNSLYSNLLDVFSPIHDVGKGIAEDVVPADIDGILESDVMFAIVDGLDSGTIFEIGYARALHKNVVV